MFGGPLTRELHRRPGTIRLLACLAAALITLTACSAESTVTEGDAVVWISDDGSHWSRVDDPDLGGSGEQQIVGATEYGPSIVAVGTTRSASDEESGDIDGQVWISADGLSWSTVDDPDLGGPGSQWINHVFVAGSRLVAAGSVSEGDDLDVAIWTSTDGHDWTRSRDPDLGGAGDQHVMDVGSPISRLGDLIVVGGMDGEDAAVWTSRDGESWSKVDGSHVLDGPEGQGILGMTSGGPGLVAVGFDDNDAAVWTSSDGSTWVEVEDGELAAPGGQRMAGVFEVDGELIAYGDSVSYEAIYYLGRGTERSTDGALWMSEDGFTWNRVTETVGFAGPGDQSFYTAGTFGTSFVVGGVDNADPRTEGLFDAEYGSGRDVDAAVWLSNDLSTWTRARSSVLQGPDWQDLYSFVEHDGMLFAFGGDDAGSG